MILTRWRGRTFSGLLVTSVVLLCRSPAIWAADVVWTGSAGDNNWNTGGNWTGGFVPGAQFEEVGVIDNGNTAFIDAHLPDGTPDAAGLVLGQAAGNSGGLEIRSGGNISFVDSTGAPDGSIVVGQDGQGTLSVLPGGSVTGTSLTVNGQSSLTVGGTTAGAASLAVGGPMNLNGTAHIIGTGHTLSGTGLALGGSSTLIAEIRSTSHSPISSTGGAGVGGTFRLEFSGGFSPAPGNKWNIIDAGAVNGAFTSIDLSGVPAPGAGTAYQFATVAGGNGQLLQLQLNTLIQLTVNTDSGAVSMSSPSGTPISIDGYRIRSAGGLLSVAQWNSLQDQSLAGWQEAAPTSMALSELNANVGGSLSVGTSAVNLGTPYTTPATFGVAPDIQFRYTAPTGEIVDGIIQYTGNATANNLLLTVNPITGQAQLRNSSKTTLQLVGYSILSESGSLLLGDSDWLSLDDQNVGSWVEANPTANALNEFFAGVGATTLSPGQSYNLGNPFNEVSGTRDLVLQFALANELIPRFGIVQYGAISAGVPGDYNNDGTVNAADYVVWREAMSLGLTSLPNEGGVSPGSVDQADYNFWRSRFGATSGAGSGSAIGSAAVPEPATWLLVIVAAVAAGGALRRRGE